MIKTFQSRATIDELQGVAGFGYWEWDLTTDEVSWSQGMYYLLGVESQSVQPGLRYVLSMLADDDKEKVVKQITSSLQKEENAILILKILRPDGGIRVIKSTSSSVFREGKAVKLTGFMQDITDICDSHNPPDQNKLPIPGEPEDRKRAELIQKNTEAMAHIGSWQFCVKTQHVHWSDELFRIFGFEPGQIQPSLDYYLKVTHPDERDRVKKILDEAFLKPGQYSFMRRIMTAQGKISHIHSRISVLRHELNADLNIIGTCQDVTPIVEAREDLIKSEEELRESCEFINRVAETSPYIIYVRDIVKKKIVYTNRELVHLLGYNNEDLTNLGSNAITSLMHPEDFVKLPDG
jgi:PAS domain S-box-containing protein